MSSIIEPPAKTRLFQKSSHIDATLERLISFHEAPLALASLTPPPIQMRVRRDDRQSLTEGEIEITLWFGPLPIRWIARHEAGPTPDSFADVQVKGPLAYWRHEHIFRETGRGVELTDRVAIAHHSGLIGLLTRLAFDGIALRLLFAYRHWRTRRALQST